MNGLLIFTISVFTFLGAWGFMSASSQLDHNPFPLFYFMITTSVLLGRSFVLTANRFTRLACMISISGASALLYLKAQLACNQYLAESTTESQFTFELYAYLYLSFVFVLTLVAPVIPRPSKRLLFSTAAVGLAGAALLIALTFAKGNTSRYFLTSNDIQSLGSFILKVALMIYIFFPEFVSKQKEMTTPSQEY